MFGRARQILGAPLLLALLLAMATPAGAHSINTGGASSGIPIPALTHGQMAVIAEYRGAILDLAGRQQKADPAFGRLLNYGNIQYSYCLWGLVPGSLRDEESPFNECSHAYLSAAQALLVKMRTLGEQADAVQALISDIDADMVRHGASFITCQFSGETFNTARVITPGWRAIPFHLPSLLTFALLAIMIGASVLALAGRNPRHQY
jgi:hypothetical protein